MRLSIRFANYSIWLLLLCSQVFATVSNGIYLGLEAGIEKQIITYTNNFNLAINGTNLVSSGLAPLGRFNLGYSFNKYSSFEVGTTYNFQALQSVPNGNFSTAAWSFDSSYLLSIPTIVDHFLVFGRVGFAYDLVKSENMCNCNMIGGVSANGFSDILGAGIKYNLSPNIVWRLEWIGNGLLFPVNLTNNSGGIGSWDSQQFQTGFNYYF